MDNILITEEILKNNGFEYLEHESNLMKGLEESLYDVKNYKIFRKWTEDEHPIKLDINNGWNNRGTKWSIHIDNEDCETIGCADIDTLDQFNKLMEIFNSEFRL